MPKTTRAKVKAEPRRRDMTSICRRISDGVALAEIASQEGISPGTLSEWIEADPERSARASRKSSGGTSMGRQGRIAD